MPNKKKSLLLTVATLTTAFILGGLNKTTRAEDTDKKINVGLQLYSLRADFAKDIPTTLDKVQQYGVDDAEVAGIPKLNAEELQGELEKRHIHASGIHAGWEDFDKNMDKVIKDAKALHCDYVTLAWIPHLRCV